MSLDAEILNNGKRPYLFMERTATPEKLLNGMNKEDFPHVRGRLSRISVYADKVFTGHNKKDL